MKRVVAILILSIMVIFVTGCVEDICTDDDGVLELDRITGDTIDVQIEHPLTGLDSILKDGPVTFESDNKDIAVKVYLDEEDMDCFGWTLKINDPSAGSRFAYKYNYFEGCHFMLSEDYPDSMDENQVYVILDGCYEDEEEKYPVMASIISEAIAHDAEGKAVKCWYEIEDEGQTVVECLEYTDDTVFPVVIE